MGHLLYFAGDRHMAEAELLKVAPGAEVFGPSCLPGHSAAVGTDGTLRLPAAGASEHAWGVLWLVPAAHLDALDRVHGVGDGVCQRTTLRVISPAGPPTQAICYVHSGAVRCVMTPAEWPLVVRAARDGNLPADYQKTLTRLAGQAAKISR